MLTWYPGQEFGPALAAVLAGDLEPGGRLPVTIAAREDDYPALKLQPDANGDLHYSEATLTGYRGLSARNIAPRHAFGAGFGYASFAVSEATLIGSVSQGAAVSVNIRNTSEVAGSEVVQVYREAPELALIGFAKISLQPGESGSIAVNLPKRAFEIWQDGWQMIEPPPPVFIRTSAIGRQIPAGNLNA